MITVGVKIGVEVGGVKVGTGAELGMGVGMGMEVGVGVGMVTLGVKIGVEVGGVKVGTGAELGMGIGPSGAPVVITSGVGNEPYDLSAWKLIGAPAETRGKSPKLNVCVVLISRTKTWWVMGSQYLKV